MTEELTNQETRSLKARGQLLKPIATIGREGLSEPFLKSIDEALNHHELVKVKFGEFKEQKKEMAPELAKRLSAHLVMRVGNVVVLFRKSLEPAKETEAADQSNRATKTRTIPPANAP